MVDILARMSAVVHANVAYANAYVQIACLIKVEGVSFCCVAHVLNARVQFSLCCDNNQKNDEDSHGKGNINSFKHMDTHERAIRISMRTCIQTFKSAKRLTYKLTNYDIFINVS